MHKTETCEKNHVLTAFHGSCHYWAESVHIFYDFMRKTYYFTSLPIGMKLKMSKKTEKNVKKDTFFTI